MENATQPHVVVPPSALHSSLTKSTKSKSAAPANRKRVFLYVIIGFIILLVIGAGTVLATTKGYITLPFKLPFNLTNTTQSIVADYQEKNLSQALDGLLAINSGRYQYDLTITNEPKEAGVQPLDVNLLQPETNININASKNLNANSNLDLKLGLDCLVTKTDCIAGSPLNAPSVMDSWLASIFPKDSSLNLLLSALYLKPTADEELPNSELDLTGKYSGNNLSVEAGLQLKMVDQVAYVKVTKLPAIPGIDTTAYEQVIDKWIKIEQTSYSNYILPYVDIGRAYLGGGGLENIDQASAQTLVKDILRISLEHKFIVIKETLPDETINDVDSRHWRLWFDSTKTLETYQAVVEYIKQEHPEIDAPTDQEMLDYLNSENFRRLIDQLKGNASIDIWLSVRDWLPTKLSLTYRIAIASENENLKDRQIRLSTTITLKDVNQPMTVTPPANNETIPFDNVICVLSGIALNKCDETMKATKQLNQITVLRSALTAYEQDNSSYPETLAVLSPFIEEKHSDCQAANNDADSNDNENSNSLSFSSQDFECMNWQAIINNLSTTDVFTVKPYDYKAKKNSYTLAYQWHCVEGAFDQEENYCVDGIYTATPDTFSLESDALKVQAAADKISDDDKDTLTNAEEDIYGTDPKEDDTDGDGYKDNDEINNGYNPNGEGKLVIEASGTDTSPKTRDSKRIAYLRTVQSALELYINETGDTPFAEGDKSWLGLNKKLTPFLNNGLDPASQLGCTVGASSGNPYSNKNNMDCFIYCDNGRDYLLASYTEGTVNSTRSFGAKIQTIFDQGECITNAGPLTAKPAIDCDEPFFCLGQVAS